MQLLSNQVLLKQEDAVEKVGTIFLASTAQQKDNRGTVVNIGEGKLLPSGVKTSMTVSVGNNVIFLPLNAVEITFNGSTHLLVSEDDILAIL